MSSTQTNYGTVNTMIGNQTTTTTNNNPPPPRNFYNSDAHYGWVCTKEEMTQERKEAEDIARRFERVDLDDDHHELARIVVTISTYILNGFCDKDWFVEQITKKIHWNLIKSEVVDSINRVLGINPKKIGYSKSFEQFELTLVLVKQAAPVVMEFLEKIDIDSVHAMIGDLFACVDYGVEVEGKPLSAYDLQMTIRSLCRAARGVPYQHAIHFFTCTTIMTMAMQLEHRRHDIDRIKEFIHTAHTGFSFIKRLSNFRSRLCPIRKRFARTTFNLSADVHKWLFDVTRGLGYSAPQIMLEVNRLEEIVGQMRPYPSGFSKLSFDLDLVNVKNCPPFTFDDDADEFVLMERARHYFGSFYNQFSCVGEHFSIRRNFCQKSLRIEFEVFTEFFGAAKAIVDKFVTPKECCDFDGCWNVAVDGKNACAQHLVSPNGVGMGLNYSFMNMEEDVDEDVEM